MPPSRLLLRTAQRLPHILLARRTQRACELPFALDHLLRYEAGIRASHGRLQDLIRRNWPAALQQVEEDLVGQLRCLSDAVEQARQHLVQAPRDTLQLRTLVEDLTQLEDEFDDVRIDLSEKKISVTTEPITLEEIYLGPFRVELHWHRLGRQSGSGCFEIVALEPNPAAMNSRVTHPHVNDGALCAGDASVPIQHALDQGRFTDAFCLVRSVLTTYNAGSPYVALDAWDGQECNDCGRCISGDDLCYCESCEHDFCPDCTEKCNACHEWKCRDCLDRCPLCEAYYCTGCLTCSALTQRICCSDCLRECGTQVAVDELDPRTRLCTACQDERAQESSRAGSTPTSIPSGEPHASSAFVAARE